MERIEEYLGDALYVSFDGTMITLFTQNQMVYLEPEVLENFLDFIKKIKEK